MRINTGRGARCASPSVPHRRSNPALRVKAFIGTHEYLHNEKRWVLWLAGASPKEIQQLPEVMERVQAVAQFRKASKAQSTRAYPYPTLFRQVTQPQSDYILVPGHTSETRAFIPFGFFSKDVIVGNSRFSLPNATLFHFGVIQSTMHMAWVRYTCGRIKSDYRYSKDIVYNNYPWPDLSPSNQPPTQAGRAQDAIEIAAKAVLDARAQFPDSSLADLYDPLSMPPALVKAHQKLDAAVDKAYEPGGGRKSYKNDAERVAFLLSCTSGTPAFCPLKKPGPGDGQRNSLTSLIWLLLIPLAKLPKSEPPDF